MKYLFINSVCGIRSTGRICTDLAQKLESEGHVVKIAYGREPDVPVAFQKYAVKIGNDFDLKMHALKTRLFDKHGLGSKRATKSFLEWAESYDPDVLWLHNIHGYYINYELLFDWIKSRPQMKVKWTLHDCWAFTGHCSYFTLVKCEQWQSHCSYCPQKGRYPGSILKDSSYSNYDRKRKAFTGVVDMTLITPSQWLADLVKHSFLRDYPVEVHYNNIDTSVFKPSPSNFRERYKIVDKKVILGVASVWDDRKGFNDFLRLHEILNDKYVIVLVGLSEKQIADLPDGIIGIHRTNSSKELAEIYTAADVFFNPTYEDNYPTVNLEAEACGTPVITYRTGGAPETLHREDSLVINVGDYCKIWGNI